MAANDGRECQHRQAGVRLNDIAALVQGQEGYQLRVGRRTSPSPDPVTAPHPSHSSARRPLGHPA